MPVAEADDMSDIGLVGMPGTGPVGMPGTVPVGMPGTVPVDTPGTGPVVELVDGSVAQPVAGPVSIGIHIHFVPFQFVAVFVAEVPTHCQSVAVVEPFVHFHAVA